MFWNLLFGNSAQAQDWANKARYAQANLEWTSGKAGQCRVVMMGNSITEFWEELHPGFFADNGLVGRETGDIPYRYISQEAGIQTLTWSWNEDGSNPIATRTITINAMPAATLTGTVEVLNVTDTQNNIITSDKFSVLYTITNNGTTTYDEDITVDNIRSMVELALNNDIQVVLSSVLPCDSFVWNTSVLNVQDKILSLNRRILALAQEFSLPYINYYPSMVYGNRLALHPAYTDDGVHPNSAGYNVMEDLLLEVLEHINW